jgi:heptaprenyl diphosphate synthase
MTRDPSLKSADALDAFLAALNTRLFFEVDRTPVAAPARRLLEAGGKRLRARLLWWSARATAPLAFEPTHERLVRAAAAVELAHLGSLVHDDIVDGGDARRGVPTLHRTHGVRVATDTGAALAHLANELVAPLVPAARAAVRRALLATCRGQIRELAVPFVPVTPARRLAIMREKTGAFFELAGVLGASVVDAPTPARAAVARFARRFGVAFQIADDVLDIAGDPNELGRPNGADLRDGVLTLPVVIAFQRDPALARALARVQRDPNVDAVRSCAAMVTRAGGVAAAVAMANAWLERALGALAPLGRNDAVAALADLARASIARGVRPGVPRFESFVRHQPAPQLTSPFRVGVDAGSRANGALGSRLTSLLDWFHPGLAAMVDLRAADPDVDAYRVWARDALCRGRRWSAESRMAADAIALAHALFDDTTLEQAPIPSLALIDALHSAAIGFLNRAVDPAEHETMSARARAMVGRPSPRLVTGLTMHHPEPPPSLSYAPLA